MGLRETGVGVATGAVVAGGDVGREVAVGAMGVGEGGGTVAGTKVGTVGVAVAGTGVGVEPEQAATKAANNVKNRAKTRIEAHRRLKSFGGRLKMLTSFLRTVVCWWMYPLARPIDLPGG